MSSPDYSKEAPRCNGNAEDLLAGRMPQVSAQSGPETFFPMGPSVPPVTRVVPGAPSPMRVIATGRSRLGIRSKMTTSPFPRAASGNVVPKGDGCSVRRAGRRSSQTGACFQVRFFAPMVLEEGPDLPEPRLDR